MSDFDKSLKTMRENAYESIAPVGLKDYSNGTKMFNTFWADQRLDAVLSELAKDKNRNTEIIQASQLIEIARQLIKNYNDRLRATNSEVE